MPDFVLAEKDGDIRAKERGDWDVGGNYLQLTAVPIAVLTR